MITLLFTCIAALGIVLFLRGWRGREVDDHPHCRKCGYDLTGRPETSRCCAECGADLQRRRSITKGKRSKQRGLIVAGLCLIAFDAATLSVMAWQVDDWTPYKPAWLLRQELEGPHPDKAFAELEERLKANSIWDFDVQRIVHRTLELQANRALAWDGRWGRLFADAVQAGRVSENDIEAYLAHALTEKVATRSRVQRGMPIPLSIATEFRCGWPDGMEPRGSRTFTFTIGNSKQKYDMPLNQAPSAVSLSDAEWKGIVDGTQSLQITVDTKISGFRAKKWVNVSENLTLPLVVSSEPTVVLRHDPAILQALKGELSAAIAPRTTFNGRSTSNPHVEIGGRVTLCVACRAFLVFSNGREMPVGQVIIRPSAPYAGLGYIGGPMLTGLTSGETCDLVLRPAPDAAARTLDIDEICGDEIVLPNLKIP